MPLTHKSFKNYFRRDLVSIFHDYQKYPPMNKLGVIFYEGQAYEGEKRGYFGFKIKIVYEKALGKKNY